MPAPQPRIVTRAPAAPGGRGGVAVRGGAAVPRQYQQQQQRPVQVQQQRPVQQQQRPVQQQQQLQQQRQPPPGAQPPGGGQPHQEGGPPYQDDAAFERGVRRCIPSEFNLIAGAEDTDEAMEAYNAKKAFGLPNTVGKEGGVCTSALLQCLYKNPKAVLGAAPPMSCQDFMKNMHTTMTGAGFDSVPQMCSSRPFKPNRPFYLVPPGATTGRRRALLIGINFIGTEKQLRAPHNDCHNIQQFLLRAGWKPADMIVLKDDGKHGSPTRRNIEAGLAQMVNTSEPGDTVIISYSGHGGRPESKKAGDHNHRGGFDSSIFPVDYQTAGQMIDDEILNKYVKAMKPGVHTTMIVDCCHSGSFGDLPYTWAGNGRRQKIEPYFDMDTHEQAMDKEAAAANAEVERKRAKAERKAAREAMRQKKREDAEKAAQMGTPQIVMPANMPAGAQVFTSPAQAQAFAKQFEKQTTVTNKNGTTTTTTVKMGQPTMMMGGGPGGGGPKMMMGAPMTMTPAQAAAMGAKGGGMVMMGAPMTMTPAQAAAMGAKGGGVVMMQQQPVMTTTTVKKGGRAKNPFKR